MPGKSSGSLKRKSPGNKGKKNSRNSAIARPFAGVVTRQATDIAGGYQVVLETADGHWYGRGLELPHVFADGDTPDACVAATQQAMAVAVAYLLEQGQSPPAAARSARRTQQVNVRLTSEEKAIIEASARNKGFSGLSDYLRNAALEATGKPTPARRKRRRAS